MKEQALEIVSKLIDQHKITGQEAVILINSIVTSSCNYSAPIITDSIKPGPIDCDGSGVIIRPYGTNITEPVIKGMEITYDNTSTNKEQEIIYD
jgi:hypothetical protein